MELAKAKKYLEAVIAHERCIPFTRFTGHVGRTGQAKNEGNPIGQGRWPVKSAEFLLNLLKNAESNAEARAGLRSPLAGRQPPAASAVQQSQPGARACTATLQLVFFCVRGP
jgi:hypothetical protein